jgi:MFS family permease
MMTSAARCRVLILAACQALMLMAAVLALTLGALVGHTLAADKSLATLPVAASVIGTALASTTVSFAIERLGWRGGFLLGTALGAASGLVATYATAAHDFWLFVAGYTLTGAYQAFGNF